MTDHITQKERALIDAAIAAGNVTRCEPGAWNEYEPIPTRERVRIMFRNRVRGQRIRAADGEGHAANANWTERWNARMRSALRVVR